MRHNIDRQLRGFRFTSFTVRTRFFSLLAGLLVISGSAYFWLARADDTAQTLPFTQNWTTTTLITANDNWSGVPGIEGFLGQDITTGMGVDPQTLLTTSSVANDLDVIANQSNPNTNTAGGVGEFDGIANPTIALQGSGTADAPYVLFHLNTTGFTNINVAYNLRDIDGSADNAVQPVALQYRIGNTGNFTNVPAGFVADATTGPNLATLVTPVCVALPVAVNNQPFVQVRVITSNAVGSDEWVGIDDINITGTSSGLPILSINDVSVTEGNADTVTAQFTVSLSQPAGVGGVIFDIATADNTATTANNDYIANSLTGQTIPQGSSSYTFNVTVNGDTTPEPNETFFVNVTNVTGATVGDGQGQGTILNDDVTPIHTIQGSGNVTALSGSVMTEGIVTGLRNNGFYLQTPDAEADADPATSQAIFVFTSSTPPAAAAVGNRVRVSGNVTEFIPSGEICSNALLRPNCLPEISLTQLTSPTVTQLSTGNPLPTPITLNPPTPGGGITQLERYEFMRVRIDSLTVVAPTGGFKTETAATSTSDGVFHGIINEIGQTCPNFNLPGRPYREAGIESPEPVPPGSGAAIPPVPRFDGNPERIRVDSDALGQAPIDVTTGATVTNLQGVLDYAFRTYTLFPDGTATPTVTGNVSAIPLPAPQADLFYVGTFNLERFYDNVDDPGGDTVLTTTAYNNRLNKASLAIRNILRSPDIIGVVEVEHIAALTALANKINSDAVAASQPNPMYTAHLVEGNDVGGIDVGFLVKTAIVTGSTPRVTVNAVVQEGATATYTDPTSGNQATLHDRPPLRLMAVVNHADGRTFPLTVIVNHLRSLNGINDPTANGLSTEGNRVRTKRIKQAEFLANLVQARQQADPNERILLCGDFNAFKVNDGYANLMGVIQGTPNPDNEDVVATPADLVNPDLINLINDYPGSLSYTYVFGGNAQPLDHILVNQPLHDFFSQLYIGHLDADFPEIYRTNANRPERISDHDAPVAAFEFDKPPLNAPTIHKAFGTFSIQAGGNTTVTLTLNNTNATPLTNASFTHTLTNMSALGGAVTGTCVGTTPATLTAGATALSFSGITIPANSHCSVVFSVTSNTLGAHVNTTSGVTTTETPTAGAASNPATLTVYGAPTIAKAFSPTSIASGETSTVTLTLSNSLTFGVLGSFTDTLTNMTAVGGPIGTTCATLSSITLTAGATNLNFSDIVIPGSGSCTVSFGVTSTVVGTHPNTTSGITTDQSPDAGPPSNTANLTVTSSHPTTLARRAVRNDFDGDGQSDLARWDSATGEWQVHFSTDGELHRIALVAANDKEESLPVAADFDGDGKTDGAVWQPNHGRWLIRQSSNDELVKAQFGLVGDLPLAADFDGDGRADYAVWRNGDGLHVWRSSDQTEQAIYLGQAGDVPVLGDFDGDQRADLAVFHAPAGRWLVRDTATGQTSELEFGQAGDMPLAGDFDGDGKDDLVLWRQAKDLALVRGSSDQAIQPWPWGRSDTVIIGDYDGDGRAEPALWRTAKAAWDVLFNQARR